MRLWRELLILFFLGMGTILPAPAQNTVSVEVRNAFPEKEDEVFLAYATDLEIAGDDVYVCDQDAGAIYRFDRTGTFQEQIGRPGRGPGEFHMQSEISVQNDLLFVDDAGNRRIQVLNRTGEHIRSFNITITFRYPFAHDSTLYGVTASSEALKMWGEESVISAFDFTGDKIRSFGKYLDWATKLTPVASTGIVEIHNSRVYYLSHYYPVLRIYDLDGTLLRDVRLDGRDYRSLVPKNYEWENLKADQRSYPFRYLFKSLTVNEEGIFVGLYESYFLVDQYSLEGQYLRSYKREPTDSENYTLMDLEMEKRKNGRLRFYSLAEDSVPKVNVLTPKTSNK